MTDYQLYRGQDFDPDEWQLVLLVLPDKVESYLVRKYDGIADTLFVEPSSGRWKLLEVEIMVEVNQH